jgi:hypothetical protein
MSRSLAGFAVALCALAGPATAGDSLRCLGGIVGVGDHKIDLLGKCGEPALQEARLEDRWQALPTKHGHTRLVRGGAVTVERWTYNFGERQFLQFVTIEMGKVTAVERGGYGYDLPRGPAEPAPIPRAVCEPSAIRAGDSTFDLLARCGEPALRDSPETSNAAGGGGAAQSSLEVWTYDFGPSSFVRFVHIDAGKVVRVETGSYGYAR